MKSPLAAEVLNIARFHIPDKIKSQNQKQILKTMNMEDVSKLCLDRRLYTKDLTKSEKAKQDSIVDKFSSDDENRSCYIDSILEKLTPDDVRCLIRSEDELAQIDRFQRIFPTQDTHTYLSLLQQVSLKFVLFCLF